jgi:hypothetical protein
VKKGAAKRNYELVTDPAAERTRLGKSQMVRIRPGGCAGLSACADTVCNASRIAAPKGPAKPLSFRVNILGIKSLKVLDAHAKPLDAITLLFHREVCALGPRSDAFAPRTGLWCPDAMAALAPEPVRAIRDALDEAMTSVPTEYATSETKAYLAEYILKAAAQGHTTHNEWVAAAGDQIQNITSALT